MTKRQKLGGVAMLLALTAWLTLSEWAKHSRAAAEAIATGSSGLVFCFIIWRIAIWADKDA